MLAEDKINELSFYSGTFDVIDKEGDDQANVFGLEHQNEDLFRNTFRKVCTSHRRIHY